MADQTVRCPYCVLGDNFRPMLPRPEGWFCLPEVWSYIDPREPGVPMLLSEVHRSESGSVINMGRTLAIKKGQTREKAVGFQEMGVFRCDNCGEEFPIVHEALPRTRCWQRCKRSGSRRYLLRSTNATRNTLIESNCRARIFAFSIGRSPGRPPR